MQGLVSEVKDQWQSESDKIDKKLDTLIQLECEKLQLEREKLELEQIKLGLHKPTSSGGTFHKVFAMISCLLLPPALALLVPTIAEAGM